MIYVQLGHDRLAHEHPAYRDLVKNAILFRSSSSSAALIGPEVNYHRSPGDPAGGHSPARWRNGGEIQFGSWKLDDASKVAFVDPEKSNFRFKPGAPARSDFSRSIKPGTDGMFPVNSTPLSRKTGNVPSVPGFPG